MPYALTAPPGQPGHLLVGLRGGTLLVTDDAGETWSRLPVQLTDVIDLAAAPVAVGASGQKQTVKRTVTLRLKRR
jgi:photosystem II stability/assembly factor-like uncharacterized protein